MHILSRIVLIGLLLGACSTTLPPIAQAVLPPVTNFAKVQVSTVYNSAATSIVLLSGHGAKLPNTFAFPLVWWNCSDFGAPEDDPFVEIVSVTARSTDTLTIVRAQDGTSANNHNTGGKTYCMILTITKGMWDQIRTDIAAASAGATLNGTGSPEGVVTAAVGTLYRRTDAWSGLNILYQKVSGTGNIGWLAVPDLSSPGIIGATTPAPATFTSLNAIVLLSNTITLGRAAPTYGTTVSINADTATLNTITATNTTPFIIANPTGGENGRLLVIKIVNNSGGTITFTWDTQYKMAAMNSIPPGFTRWVWFVSNGTNWVEALCSPLVPN